MTRGQREKLSEIMGYLWAKSDDSLCAGQYLQAVIVVLAILLIAIWSVRK